MRPDLVLIAISTGGPEALKTIVPKLDKNLGVPIIVVQHMTDGFTKTLAESLNEISDINIKEAEENERIEKSKMYIAKAGVHMKLYNNNHSVFPKVLFSDEEKVNFVKPAADVLFKDVANKYTNKNILVIVGTGMGKDGLEGIKELKKKCNVYCITESELDCTVYGMPRAVNEAGLSNEQTRIDKIPLRINYLCKKGWR